MGSRNPSLSCIPISLEPEERPSPPSVPPPKPHDFAYEATSQPSNLWPPPQIHPTLATDMSVYAFSNTAGDGTGGMPHAKWKGGTSSHHKEYNYNYPPSIHIRKHEVPAFFVSENNAITEQPYPIKDVAYWTKVMEEEERRAEIKAAQRGCLLNRIFEYCCPCCCSQ
ncbi:hypothetical protein H072_406 [Dactylellina haptotyla CBS 200.50]|uniref:Uncharacterized protein n=1 Tax=Dactylellina haptotyla (strain CBS 200.50) TaxID=1284197 RepID=S8C1H2_DACHA|nr:hypothetical protein H072_406 [Dactylellina haptotyla CBS 200.50]